jgi:hypothetical protein
MLVRTAQPRRIIHRSEHLLNLVRRVLAKPHCHRAVRMSVVSALRTGATVGPCGTAAGSTPSLRNY